MGVERYRDISSIEVGTLYPFTDFLTRLRAMRTFASCVGNEEVVGSIREIIEEVRLFSQETAIFLAESPDGSDNFFVYYPPETDPWPCYSSSDLTF